MFSAKRNSSNVHDYQNFFVILPPRTNHIIAMQQMRHLIYIVTLALLIAGCANDAKGPSDGEGQRVSQPVDTLYTCDAAMMIFAFQPVRALQILDSAVLVGHVSRVQADQCRARIYTEFLSGPGHKYWYISFPAFFILMTGLALFVFWLIKKFEKH